MKEVILCTITVLLLAGCLVFIASLLVAFGHDVGVLR